MTTYDPDLLDALEALPTQPWRGKVWRHMFNDYPPDRVNTGGARWNPPGVAAIYTALSRQTALVEGQHAIDIQPRRVYASRTVYEVEVSIASVVDLTGPHVLAAVGITDADIESDDMTACQRVGGAAAWLGVNGLLVPSARDPGANLVIIVGTDGLDDDLLVVASEIIEQRSKP